MSDFAVGTAFTATDKITNTFGRMGKGADKFGGKTSAAFRRAGSAGSRFQDIVKGILVTDILKGSIRGLTNGLRSAGEEFINYDAAITGATAKFKGLNIETAEGAAQFAALKTQARDLGATTEFSATQAAEGLEFLAMAGLTAEQSMALLPGVVDLATASKTDLARATDIASDSLGAFGLVTEDNAQLTKNMARVNDVFAKTTVIANTGMEALFESATKAGPAFTAAGQSIESFAALTGVLASSGVKGSEAGTQLRNAMLKLADATPAASKVLRKLGVDIKDEKGNFNDIIDIVADFEKGLIGMGTAQRTQALATVFGSRSVTGMNILLKQGSESLRDYRKSLIDSGGSSKEMADKIRLSLGNQLASLKSAAIELGFKFFDAFEGKIGPAIQSVTKFVREIDMKAMIGQFESIIAVGMKFRGVLIGLGVGWGIFAAGMKAVAIFQAISGFIKFVGVLKAAAGAQGLLNAVMIANPIGAIAVGVGLLIGGMILLADNFDVVSAAFMATVKFLGNGIAELFDFLMGPFRLASDLISSLVDLTGLGGGDDDAAAPQSSEAPNKQALRAQQVQFQGRLDIAGAPEGSTVQSETIGAPPVRMDLAGAN